MDDWIRKSPEEPSRTLALRVSSINVFLKFATDNGYNAALLQNTKKSSSNYIPYIFTDQELIQLSMKRQNSMMISIILFCFFYIR